VEKRLVAFIALSFALLMGSVWLETQRQAHLKLAAQQNAPQDVGKDKNAKGKAGEKNAGQNAEKNADNGKVGAAPEKGPPEKAGPEKAPGEKNPPDKNPAGNGGAAQANAPAEEAKKIDAQWFTLGSVASADNPYEMLVTLTNRGAAVERIELSNPRYRDAENRSGYLGSLALVSNPKAKSGCVANVVGKGTPAAEAGMQAGDVITNIGGTPISKPDELVEWLNANTKPGESVQLTIERGGAPQNLTAKLTRYPLSVVRPEIDTEGLEVITPGKHDPLSLLFTLRSADNDEIDDPTKVDAEIAGLHLRTGNWAGRQVDADTVEFTRKLPKWKLEVVKRFHLARQSEDKPAYHLLLTVEVRNEDVKQHTVAYQLDGATGLPTEGWWYASRISPEWSGLALRDVAYKFQSLPDKIINSMALAAKWLAAEEAANNKGAAPPEIKKEELIRELNEAPLVYVGVDAQYFAAMLLPLRPTGAAGGPPKDLHAWLADIHSIVVGSVPKDAKERMKVDVTCRLTSVDSTIEPGKSLEHEYEVFVGPKQPHLLEQYGDAATGENLHWLVYYGWFGWVAAPMVAVLGLFHHIVGNYGIAIILLTVLVRLCMFPLSRKQAMSAKKMQELQPEMKKINEKYKANAEQKTRAMQELWRKHNYNPLGGCLLLFVQLPIFMGLYRSLMVNVELRDAPLLGSAVRWCSNLAAPDMFYNWEHVMPSILGAPTGWMGPYLNILPLLTVGLFLWQQIVLMPPATDDNSAMQQKIMRYMTIFMGLMFFKVAAGLCLYFIVSSMWGIAERKLLPKVTPAPGAAPAVAVRSSPASSNGSGGSSADRKKQRGRKG
jgi:YidC/Oxa1 family membrane protein insertase